MSTSRRFPSSFIRGSGSASGRGAGDGGRVGQGYSTRPGRRVTTSSPHFSPCQPGGEKGLEMSGPSLSRERAPGSGYESSVNLRPRLRSLPYFCRYKSLSFGGGLGLRSVCSETRRWLSGGSSGRYTGVTYTTVIAMGPRGRRGPKRGRGEFERSRSDSGTLRHRVPSAPELPWWRERDTGGGDSGRNHPPRVGGTDGVLRTGVPG